MAKICPISNHPVDLISHKPTGPWQIACPASHWQSSLFNDLDDAIEFRSTLNIPELVATARKETRGDKVRLVNDKWMTTFMSPSELDRLVAAAGPLPPKSRRRRPGSDTESQDAPVQ